MWPSDAESLVATQEVLATAAPEPWAPLDRPLRAGGCWVCFPRGVSGPGRAGERAWVGAVVTHGDRVVSRYVGAGAAAAPYRPGLMALRVGPLLEQAVRRLEPVPDVLLLDATGRDHPRRAGFALHLGAELDLPTVGVTHRPLTAEGAWPAEAAGSTSPLRIGEEVVGCWLRTRARLRPLAVHPGWRTDLATAVQVVLASARRRTPEPLRLARHLARSARSAEERPTGDPAD